MSSKGFGWWGSLELLKIFIVQWKLSQADTLTNISFRLPLCRKNIRQFSVFYQGPKFFNSLSPEITGSSSLVSFRKKLETSIIINYLLC